MQQIFPTMQQYKVKMQAKNGKPDASMTSVSGGDGEEVGGGGLVAKQLALDQPVEMVKLCQVALAKLLFLFAPGNQFYYLCKNLPTISICYKHTRG